MFSETTPDSHVWEIRDEPEHLDGWYFSDESGDFNGPFETVEEATRNLGEHIKWTNPSVEQNVEALPPEEP